MKKIAKYGLLCGLVMFAGINSLSAKSFTAKELDEKTATVDTINGQQVTIKENLYVFGTHAFVNSYTTLNIVEASVTIDFNKTPILYFKNGNGIWKDALRSTSVNIKDNTTFEITKMMKTKTGNETTITGEGNATVTNGVIIETFPSSGNPSVPVIPDTESNLNVTSVVNKTEKDENFTVSFDSTKKTLVINEVKPAAANGKVTLTVDLGAELANDPLVHTTIEGLTTATKDAKEATKVTIEIPQTDKSYQNVALMFIDDDTNESTLIYVTYNAKEAVALSGAAGLNLTELKEDETIVVATSGVAYDAESKSFIVSNKESFEFTINKNDVDTGEKTSKTYNVNKNAETGKWVATIDLELVSVKPVKAADLGEETLTYNHELNTSTIVVGTLNGNAVKVTVNGPMVTYTNAGLTGEVFAVLVDLGVDPTTLKISERIGNAEKATDYAGTIVTGLANVKKHSANPDELTDTTFVLWLTKAATRELTFADKNNTENKETLTITMANSSSFVPFALNNAKAASAATDSLEDQGNIIVSKPSCVDGKCTVNVKQSDVFTGTEYALILDFGANANRLTATGATFVTTDAEDYGVTGTEVALTGLTKADKTFTVTNKDTKETITVEIKFTEIEKAEFTAEGSISNITVTKQNGVADDEEITATTPNYVTLKDDKGADISYFAMTKADGILEFTFKVGNDSYRATRANTTADWAIVKSFNLKGAVSGGVNDGLTADQKYSQESIQGVTTSKDENGTPIINVQLNRDLTNGKYRLVLDLGTPNTDLKANASIIANGADEKEVAKYLVGKNLNAKESVVIELSETDTDYDADDETKAGKTITFVNKNNEAEELSVIVRSTYVKSANVDYLELKSVKGLTVNESNLTEEIKANPGLVYDNNSIESISISQEKGEENTINVVLNRELSKADAKVGFLIDLGKNPTAEINKEETTGIKDENGDLLVIDADEVAKFGGRGNQFIIWVGLGESQTITYKNNYESNKAQELTITINVTNNFKKIDASKFTYTNAGAFVYTEIADYTGNDPKAITINGVKYTNEDYTLNDITGKVYTIEGGKLKVAEAFLALNATNESSFEVKFGISKTFRVQLYAVSNPNLDLLKTGTGLTKNENGNITITATADETDKASLTIYNNGEAITASHVFVERTITKTVKGETVTETEIKAIKLTAGAFDLDYYTVEEFDRLKAGETKTETVTMIVPGYGKLVVTLKVTTPAE